MIECWLQQPVYNPASQACQMSHDRHRFKCRLLCSIGCDQPINYKKENLKQVLRGVSRWSGCGLRESRG